MYTLQGDNPTGNKTISSNMFQLRENPPEPRAWSLHQCCTLLRFCDTNKKNSRCITSRAWLRKLHDNPIVGEPINNRYESLCTMSKHTIKSRSNVKGENRTQNSVTSQNNMNEVSLKRKKRKYREGKQSIVCLLLLLLLFLQCYI